MSVRNSDYVVSSHNYFLNSDDGRTDGQYNVDFQLGQNSIKTTGLGQYIRLTLSNFSMYKNWTNVNGNNNFIFYPVNTGGVISWSAIEIPQYNYSNIYDIVDVFSSQVKTALLAQLTSTWGSSTDQGDPTFYNIVQVSPGAGTTLDGTTDNIVDFQLQYTGDGSGNGFPAFNDVSGSYIPNDISLNTLLLDGFFGLMCIRDPANMQPSQPLNSGQPYPAGGDPGLLYGVDRHFASVLDANGKLTDINNMSFQFSMVGNNLRIQGRYPAQRSTELNVFLRVNPVPEVYASATFENIDKPINVQPDNILAEMRIDSEVVQFSPQTGREYFVNFHQQMLNHLQLTLTDSRNRLLPVYGTRQTTLGNRSFTCTLRADIIAGNASGERPSHLQVNIPKQIGAKFEKVLINQKDGEDPYGKPPHY